MQSRQTFDLKTKWGWKHLYREARFVIRHWKVKKYRKMFRHTVSLVINDTLNRGKL